MNGIREVAFGVVFTTTSGVGVRRPSPCRQEEFAVPPPVLSPPLEWVRMGSQGSPVKSYDYLLKFLLVGDSDVGKGEILDSLQDGSAESPYAYSSGESLCSPSWRLNSALVVMTVLRCYWVSLAYG